MPRPRNLAHRKIYQTYVFRILINTENGTLMWSANRLFCVRRRDYIFCPTVALTLSGFGELGGIRV